MAKKTNLSLVKNSSIEDLLSETGKGIPPSGIREFFDIVYSTPDCISLGVGEPDFSTPWRMTESAINAAKNGFTHYTPNRGLPELCRLISEYLSRDISVQYDPETEIIISLGVSQGLDIALRSIINPGDEIIMFEPCYVSYAPNIRLLYGKPVVISTRAADNFTIDIDEIKNSITPKTKGILLNYPSNPTGATIDKKTLEEIAKLAMSHNLVVIADEIYSQLTYEKEHFSIVSIPGMKERTIYLNGFSKAYAMTGWRIGYIAGPVSIINVMLKIHQYTALCASSVAQYAAVEALLKGEKDVKIMKKEFHRRKNFAVGRLNDIGLPCYDPDGAIYVFPDISSTGLNSRDFAIGLLNRKKVAVVPGMAFGEAGTNHVRCSFATSMENLRESFLRIEEYVKSL